MNILWSKVEEVYEVFEEKIAVLLCFDVEHNAWHEKIELPDASWVAKKSTLKRNLSIIEVSFNF